MPKNSQPLFPILEFVAIDTETTGLDPENDSIIELGAVKFKDGLVSETFNTLIYLGGPLPLFISKLTGINEADLKTAPKIEEKLPEFMDFIGDLPIVGHNPSFDIDFINANLKKVGMPAITDKAFDTVTISRILLPRLTSHDLEMVCAFFNISVKEVHRASSDAELSGKALVKMWEYGLTLDRHLIETLVYLTSAINDPSLFEFLGLITQAPDKVGYSKLKTNPEYLIDFNNILGTSKPIDLTYDAEAITKELKEGSRISETVPQFKERDLQLEMIAEVALAFESDRSLLIEAGTGTGKSFAYLIPAIYWALSNNTRVIISTNTKNLQEQLFFKDIPTVRKTLSFDFKATLLKGMANYLCLRRFNHYIRNPLQLSNWERQGLLYLVKWAAHSRSGDIVENTSFHRKRYASLWEKIKGDGYKCLGKRCQFFKQCFINNIRREQKDSQIAVINHSLLLSDLKNTGVGILGEYGYVVIDEAHNLDKVAIEFLGATLTTWDIRAILSELVTKGRTLDGILPSITNRYIIHSKTNLPAKLDKQYRELVSIITESSGKAEAFFTTLAGEYQRGYNWQAQPYPLRTRYVPSTPLYEEYILPLGSALKEQLQNVVKLLREFLFPLKETDDELLLTIIKEGEGEQLKLEELCELLERLLAPDDLNSVFWIEAPPKKEGNDIKLCWAPLNVGELIYHEFIENMNSIIFTSATLTVAGEFDYILERIGLNFHPPERVKEVLLGYQFDYDEQLKVYIPQYLPLPGAPQFAGAASEMIEVVATHRGGILVLSTSYAMLDTLYRSLRNNLEHEGILILGQGISGSRSKITNQFRENKNSILLGTESFWEGVDIPGEALQILVLLKLPFAVPTDPYVLAYSEWLQERGEDAFNRYIVPEAVIKFRQGIGRLIRTETDRGVLVIMDKRIIRKRYGIAFLNSLPTVSREVWSNEELIELINQHLGG